jgi:hypothetical protein
MIRARMRAGATWSDACILNFSTRGMLVRAARSPSRGSYLEIRRGDHMIMARVVWSDSGRFGVQTQDPVPADRLILDPQGSVPTGKLGETGLAERRSAPRPPEAGHQASRRTGGAMEFAALALTGAFAAVLVGGAVAQIAAGPVTAAQAALALK